MSAQSPFLDAIRRNSWKVCSIQSSKVMRNESFGVLALLRWSLDDYCRRSQHMGCYVYADIYMTHIYDRYDSVSNYDSARNSSWVAKIIDKWSPACVDEQVKSSTWTFYVMGILLIIRCGIKFSTLGKSMLDYEMVKIRWGKGILYSRNIPLNEYIQLFSVLQVRQTCIALDLSNTI